MKLPTFHSDVQLNKELANIVCYEKNTFLNFATLVRSQRKRTSLSVPATFKVASEDSIDGSMMANQYNASIQKATSLAAMSATVTQYVSDSDDPSDAESATAWVPEECGLRSGAGNAVAAAGSLVAKTQPESRAEQRTRDPVMLAAAPERPRLSTKAKAFVSTTAAIASQPKSPQNFNAQVESVLLSVRSALFCMGFLANVSKSPATGGWSVCAQVQHGSQARASMLLAGAKRALVRGVEQSTSVYLLGYRAQPFTDSASGFSATLCGVEDENVVCWDYCSTGICRRGCACKWAHPDFQVSVSVSV